MIYRKWESSPIIVSFSTREKPIYEIPFPAVTICPESKSASKRYSHSTIIKRLMRYRNLTQEEYPLNVCLVAFSFRYKTFSYMNLLCHTVPSFIERGKPKNMTFDNYFYSVDDFFEVVFNVSYSILYVYNLKDIGTNYIQFCESFLRACEWMNKEYSCNQLFDLVITDEGICATFNMLDTSKIYRDVANITWTLDEGYSIDDDMHTFPKRALYSGASSALKFSIIESNENIDQACTKSLQGFKVTLHTPTRVPRPSQQYFRVPLDAIAITAVKPVMVTTSKRVKDFKPEKRQCYFETEKYLKYFKLYTQRNCQLECLSNFTLAWCGCIPYCDCLPLCTDLSYEVETSTSAWDWIKMIDVYFPPLNTSVPREKSISKTSMIIYFKTNHFITTERHELYAILDMLGSFGGLLGLFTGFSILSLMEIIYFLTVRIICNIKLFGNWSGECENDVEKNLPELSSRR
ncbi:hypothetical protein D910_08775, partial [Dendroctonus ponderosae]